METEWAPYLDDAMMIFGVDHFIGWMKHIEEAEVLKDWLSEAGGREALNETRPEAKAATVAQSGGVWVSRTGSPPMISAFAAHRLASWSRPRPKLHDRPLWPSDSPT